jgi:hypothetical protein
VSVADRRAFLGVAAAAVAGVAVVGTVAGTTGLLSRHAAAAPDLAGVDEPQFTELTPFTDALRIPPTLRPNGTGVTAPRGSSGPVRHRPADGRPRTAATRRGRQSGCRSPRWTRSEFGGAAVDRGAGIADRSSVGRGARRSAHRADRGTR